jgi:hypothetical protein
MAVTSSPVYAADVFTDLAAWQAAVGSYNRDTDYGSTFADISALTLDDGTEMTFGSDVNIRQIGSGWSTWSGGYAGQVLYSNGAFSISAGLSPLAGFGFFIEPNPFSVHEFTLHLSDGSSVSGSYDGSAGAGFLGFAGAGVTGFTVSSPTTDFAFGDFYTASGLGAVPEPGTWLLMILGFGAIGGMMRARKRQNVTVSYA